MKLSNLAKSKEEIISLLNSKGLSEDDINVSIQEIFSVSSLNVINILLSKHQPETKFTTFEEMVSFIESKVSEEEINILLAKEIVQVSDQFFQEISV